MVAPPKVDIVVGLTLVVALTLVPLTLDLLRSFAFFRRGALGRALTRVTSAALIVAVVLICAIALALFFAHVLPYHCATPGSAGWLVLSSAAVYLAGGTVLTHIASVLVSPGHAPRPQAGAAVAELPPHAHFCGVCRHTVLDADHHCVFTGSCIGRYNRTPFYLFLTHLLAAATFAVAASAQPFSECVVRRLRAPAGAPPESACAAIGPGQIALVPALMIWLPVVPLVAWHALLLRADLSTAHFVKRANVDGLFAALRELVGVPCKPIGQNRTWQLARGAYARADQLARTPRTTILSRDDAIKARES
jgi:hypothetical protein